MYLKPVLFVMLLAAMGPGKTAAPPEVAPVPESVPEPAPAEVVAEPATPEPPQLVVLAGGDADPAQFMWQQRPVVVFADSPQDPAFTEQMNALTREPAGLIQRDVVVITDTDPANPSSWRSTLHPRGFSLVLLDKDGQVKLRKPIPWSAREINRAIDKFPLRRQEIGRAGVLP
ncbi:DUF4174 domain-containing protein [Paracoccus sp. M683]|uniref:DUF4174 domain-containing protein n=1 Tax=Paracoccus sp. M683 TaxID=2594268 RepID=UPI00117FCE62|nr:DUF4174 domain-containing protein [Paracoccus sp. M683]TRW96664.1 DUF4174 domain-containing protein [Paracoccus sp. M683]